MLLSFINYKTSVWNWTSGRSFFCEKQDSFDLRCRNGCCCFTGLFPFLCVAICLLCTSMVLIIFVLCNSRVLEIRCPYTSKHIRLAFRFLLMWFSTSVTMHRHIWANSFLRANWPEFYMNLLVFSVFYSGLLARIGVSPWASFVVLTRNEPLSHRHADL